MTSPWPHLGCEEWWPFRIDRQHCRGQRCRGSKSFTGDLGDNQGVGGDSWAPWGYDHSNQWARQAGSAQAGDPVCGGQRLHVRWQVRNGKHSFVFGDIYLTSILTFTGYPCRHLPYINVHIKLAVSDCWIVRAGGSQSPLGDPAYRVGGFDPGFLRRRGSHRGAGPVVCSSWASDNKRGSLNWWIKYYPSKASFPFRHLSDINVDIKRDYPFQLATFREIFQQTFM